MLVRNFGGLISSKQSNCDRIAQKDERIFSVGDFILTMEVRSKSIEKLEGKKSCRINTKLLPFKAHYFFAYGGLAAVVPFLPIVAKQLGVNATALGIGFSMIPIFTSLTNPIIGLLVDYFQNIKIFLIVLLITSSVAYTFTLCLPPITYENTDATYIRVSLLNESESVLNFSKPFRRSCLENILENDTECKIVFNDNKQYNSVISDEDGIINMTYNVEKIEHLNYTEENKHWITFYITNTTYLLKEKDLNSFNFQCVSPIQSCLINNESQDILSAYQFWVFFTLIVCASIANMSVNSLSSVACFELLGANSEVYGRQRLFGTIGWGIVCPLSGMLNDYDEKSFVSVIYLMIVFRTTDVIILCLTPLPKAHASSNMSRDIRIIVTSNEILTFSFGIAAIGFLTAIISVFEFWFLEDMGANRTLLGLSIFMQCLVGEVPFLFFSGWFVNKLGHFLCFTCVFIGFLVRFILYSLLKDPWLVLPVDTLHGVTFGLFHGAMASFANEKAPKGMEATVLAFFGSIYEGLGYGLGSFTGGFGLDKFGPRNTFLSASMLSLGCFVLFLIASYVFRRPLNDKRFEPVSLEIEEMPANS